MPTCGLRSDLSFLEWNTRLHTDGVVFFDIRSRICLKNLFDCSTNATMCCIVAVVKNNATETTWNPWAWGAITRNVIKQSCTDPLVFDVTDGDRFVQITCKLIVILLCLCEGVPINLSGMLENCVDFNAGQCISELVVVVTPALIVRVFKRIDRDLCLQAKLAGHSIDCLWCSYKDLCICDPQVWNGCDRSTTWDCQEVYPAVACVQKNQWMECDFRREKYLKSFAGFSSNATALACWLPHKTSWFAFHAFMFAKQREVLLKCLEVIRNAWKKRQSWGKWKNDQNVDYVCSFESSSIFSVKWPNLTIQCHSDQLTSNAGGRVLHS